jgi:hypothetical protein
MALAGMHAKDFATGGDFEAFRGSAMGLEFLFWFRSVSWHCLNPFLLWARRADLRSPTALQN